MQDSACGHHGSRSVLAGAGLPEDRQARIAARRAFVNLKQTYMLAIAELPGPRAEWLRFQVRHAADPADLWLLRGAVFDALPNSGGCRERESLQRGIETVFPPGQAPSGFAPLF